MKLDYESLDWTTVNFTFEQLLEEFTPEERDELYQQIAEYIKKTLHSSNLITIAQMSEWLKQIKRHESQ